MERSGLAIRPGVAAVIRDEEGRILLHRRRVDGGWAPPSGSLEPGEDVHAGLLRELREETGLAVDVERPVGVYSDPAYQIVHYVGHTGRRLSRQSWNIAGKIRGVDGPLQSCPRARGVVREIHPEVLFWALNGGGGMRHNKRTEDGFQERLRLLELRSPGSRAIIASVLNRFARKDVGKDDVLAAAVTAKLGGRPLPSLPAQPERDSTGLPMEIVYTDCDVRVGNWNSR